MIARIWIILKTRRFSRFSAEAAGFEIRPHFDFIWRQGALSAGWLSQAPIYLQRDILKYRNYSYEEQETLKACMMAP